MNRVFGKKLIFFLFVLLLAGFAVIKPVFAQEHFDAAVIDAEDPVLYTEGETPIYTQRILVRIETGPYTGLEEETVHSFPSPGMATALSVGDKVIVKVNTENIAEPIAIVDYSRGNYFAILAIVVILGTAMVFARNRADWSYVAGVLIAPVLAFVGAKYAGLPPVVSAGLSAVLVGTAVLAVQYTKAIPILASIISFLASYLIGGAAIYGITTTLNVHAGAIEPFLTYYGVSYPSNLGWMTIAGLLLVPFAAIISIVNSTLGEVIKTRAGDPNASRSELVKQGVTQGLNASRDAVFSFLLVVLGFTIPILLALSEEIALKDLANLELFSYLFVLGIGPILMTIISSVASGAVSGILLGSAMPHRLVSDKEAPELLSPRDSEKPSQEPIPQESQVSQPPQAEQEAPQKPVVIPTDRE